MEPQCPFCGYPHGAHSIGCPVIETQFKPMPTIGSYLMKLERRIDGVDTYFHHQELRLSKLLVEMTRVMNKLTDELLEVRECHKKLSLKVSKLSGSS